MALLLQRLFQQLRRRALGTITEFSVRDPVVALTFDDGPDVVATPQLLDLLDRFEAKATFFVVGDSAVRATALLQRFRDDGHAIGNHTWDHRSFASISRGERHRQIRDCARAIRPAGRRLFRPPWGHQTIDSRFDLLLRGYDVIGWNIDVADWADADSHRMAAQLEARIKPGSIVLLHDSIRGGELNPGQSPVYAGREAMLEALATTLARLADRFKWVTIPQMFALGRPVRRDWYHSGTARPKAAVIVPDADASVR